jgi:hypothetical protein
LLSNVEISHWECRHTAPAQNQSLLYATHQLTTAIGMVATKAHQSGRTKSAISPSRMKTIQKIFFSTPQFYSDCHPERAAGLKGHGFQPCRTMSQGKSLLGPEVQLGRLKPAPVPRRRDGSAASRALSKHRPYRPSTFLSLNKRIKQVR